MSCDKAAACRRKRAAGKAHYTQEDEDGHKGWALVRNNETQKTMTRRP